MSRVYVIDKAALNAYYLKYYAGKQQRRLRHVRMHTIIDHAWGAGLSLEQTLLDCMINGYAFCVSLPEINRIWNAWDRGYEAYIREGDQQLIADGHPELVSNLTTW